MATLSEQIKSWRTATDGQNGQGSLLSKLSIGGNLYNIKDPAVEQLAGLIETRLGTLENKTWNVVNKGASEAKFATSVSQAADGSITVTYGTIRDTALTDTTEANKVVKSIAQSVDGVVTATMGQVAAGEVAFTPGTAFNSESTTVQAAVEDALAQAMALKGTSGDESSANTIAAAKKYAEEKVQELAGKDWTAQAQKVTDIIKELEGTDAGNWATLADKLDGMPVEDASVEGGRREAKSVAEYVQAEIAKVNAANSQGIADLDANVYGADGKVSDAVNAENSYANDNSSKVVVKVTEVDGKITAVNVKTNDIASAKALTTLDNAAVKSVNSKTPTAGAVTLYASDVNLSDSDNTTIAAKLTSLDSNKANKAAIATGSVNNWSVPTYASETLTWTNVATNVYIPGTGSL